MDSAVSPYFYAFYGHHVCKVVIDTGATSTVTSRDFLHRVDVLPESTIHSARGVGKINLDVKGEVHLTITFSDKELLVNGVVLDNLDCDILAGAPFGRTNDIVTLRLKRSLFRGWKFLMWGEIKGV